MNTFSQRHGYEPPDAEITVRHDAPDWLRNLVLDIAYEVDFKPSEVRSYLCHLLLESPNQNNWTEIPNIDQEVRGMLSDAPWFYVYDLIEWLHTRLQSRGTEAWDIASASAGEAFATMINRAFRRKGVGWQLVDGKIEIRGSENFEHSVRQAGALLQQTGRQVAHHEIHQALADLSKRPDPDITGAIQHAMAALECTARDITGSPKPTLGDLVKKQPGLFPPPLDQAVKGLWGYTSEQGRHLREGRIPSAADAELVVGLTGAMVVYLLRKVEIPSS